jgi:hypothetical protein
MSPAERQTDPANPDAIMTMSSDINKMQVGGENAKMLPSQTRTPEPNPDQLPMNNQAQTPSTPGIYLPFNWDDFEARFEKALLDADNQERDLLNEFDLLVKVGLAISRSGGKLTNSSSVL